MLPKYITYIWVQFGKLRCYFKPYWSGQLCSDICVRQVQINFLNCIFVSFQFRHILLSWSALLLYIKLRYNSVDSFYKKLLYIRRKSDTKQSKTIKISNELPARRPFFLFLFLFFPLFLFYLFILCYICIFWISKFSRQFLFNHRLYNTFFSLYSHPNLGIWHELRGFDLLRVFIWA